MAAKRRGLSPERIEFLARKKITRKIGRSFSFWRWRSDAKVKAAVRRRDGFRCRDCGMTQEEHIATRGQDLHVHRILAGCAYHETHCITLCIACHAAKKNKESDDVLEIVLMPYYAEQLEILTYLASESDRLKVPAQVVVGSILLNAARGNWITPAD